MEKLCHKFSDFANVLFYKLINLSNFIQNKTYRILLNQNIKQSQLCAEEKSIVVQITLSNCVFRSWIKCQVCFSQTILLCKMLPQDRCSAVGPETCPLTFCGSVLSPDFSADGPTLVYCCHKHLAPSHHRKYDFCLCIWPTFKLPTWQMVEVKKIESVLRQQHKLLICSVGGPRGCLSPCSDTKSKALTLHFKRAHVCLSSSSVAAQPYPAVPSNEGEGVRRCLLLLPSSPCAPKTNSSQSGHLRQTSVLSR